MFVSYTVKNNQFKETAKGRGIISYQIVDDQGAKRTVSATAQINMFGKIKSVRPIYKRELPLIQALMKTGINDKIEVDFTEYNNQNPRGETTAKEIGVRKKEIPDDFKENTISDMESIGQNKFRLLQMIALGVLVLAAVMSLNHSFF